MALVAEQKDRLFATIRPEAERSLVSLQEAAGEVERLLRERERFRQKNADYLSRHILLCAYGCHVLPLWAHAGVPLPDDL